MQILQRGCNENVLNIAEFLIVVRVIGAVIQTPDIKTSGTLGFHTVFSVPPQANHVKLP